MKPTPYIAGQTGVAAHQQQSSISSVLDSGVEFAYDDTRDANGWADTFSFGNMSGAMLRVSAVGVTPPAGSVNWGAGVITIPHNLGWVPMGFLVTYKNKPCDVYAPPGNPPDKQFIYLSISDDTADTNLFIF